MPVDRKPGPRYTTPAVDPLFRQRGFNEAVGAFPMLGGTWVTGTFPAGSTLLRTNHKLGRAYIGATAFMYTEGTGFNASGLICIAPELAKTLTATPAIDIEREVLLRRATTANDLTVRFWVF